MLTIPQLKKVQADDPYLYQALKRIVGAVNALGTHIGADPAGTVAPPAAIASVQVTAANGFFNVAIVDNSTVTRAINYFLEYDASPAFPNPWVLRYGSLAQYPARTGGNQTLYFRAYSQYLGGPPGPRVAYGSPPLAVVGGGAAAPTPLPSQGSGTGGGGFGTDPDSSLRVGGPKRLANTL